MSADCLGRAESLQSSRASAAHRRSLDEHAPRRSSGADISDSVLAHIRSNPGCRAEEIMSAWGAGSDDV